MVGIGTGLLVTATCLATPHYDWDILGYVGAAASLAGASDPHFVAYSEVCRQAGPAACEKLVDRGLEFRRVVASRPDVFETVLRFYGVRIGFTASVLALAAIGVSLPQATLLVPALSAGALAVVVLLAAPRRTGPLAVATLVGTALLIGAGRIATPDSMYALLVVSGTLVWVGRRPYAAAVLLLAAMAVRFDGAIHLALLATVYLLPPAGGSRVPLRAYIGIGLTAGALLSVLTSLTDYPGWAQVISHTFFEKVVSPELPPVAIDIDRYLRLMAGLARPGWRSALALIHLVVAAAVVARTPHAALTRGPVLAVLVCAAYIVAHALLFPAWSLRFFVGHYLVIDLFALRLLVLAHEPPRA